MSHRPQAGYPTNSRPPLLRIAAALVILASIALCASCGRMGLPSPPAHIMERTTDLEAMQRGSIVFLWWPIPSLAAKPYTKYYVDHVDIYKLIERTDQDPTVDPDEYLDKAEMVKSYPRQEIERQARENGRLEFFDTLDLLGSQHRVADTRLRYAVRYVNKYGEDALFSNSVEIYPNPTVAMPPMGLTVSGVTQDKITLTWLAPTGNINGQIPANIAGYNIYRRALGQEDSGRGSRSEDESKPGQNAKKQPAPSTRPPEFELLNHEPLSKATYTDTRFRYKTHYEYMVRALSAGTSGLIETENSIPFRYTPEDVFKPSRPESVTIASANGIISLFWPANPETDIAGYNVYRADSADAPAKDWVKLNPKLNTATTFHDETPRIGIRYYYRVTAVDKFDNESEPSSPVSEVANP